MNNEVFTKKDIRAANGDPIKIAIVLNNQQGGTSHRLFSAKIKVVVLHGDFNGDNQVGWTSDEFNNYIVRPRDRVGVVLTGELELNLKDGEAYLRSATFIDNSKFTRSGKFRLGVMIADDIGERVQEGITEPFTVKDRRGESRPEFYFWSSAPFVFFSIKTLIAHFVLILVGCRKHAIPSLGDEVWRLKKISKNGVFYKALRENGIHSVKHFLRQYYKDEQALRNVRRQLPCVPFAQLNFDYYHRLFSFPAFRFSSRPQTWFGQPLLIMLRNVILAERFTLTSWKTRMLHFSSIVCISLSEQHWMTITQLSVILISLRRCSSGVFL